MTTCKYSEQLANMKRLKEKMKALYHETVEQEPTDSHWDTVYCNINNVMEQLKIHNLKAQQHQSTDPWSEKDMVNLNKILALTYACIKDCGNIKQHDGYDCTNKDGNSAVVPGFGEQMVKMKQQIDLISFEITKLKAVKDALDNIYSNYNVEMAVSSNEQDNEEECDEAVDDVFI
uniref:Uncharacterized protein n=1 Tax=Anopheles gambiae TaxID=7165 RepID=A0A453YZX5_ANOGA